MDGLLTVKEASMYLKCSRWTLYRIVGSGEISFIRHRRRILFKEQDLETFVNSRRVARLNLNFNLIKNLTKALSSNHLISEVKELASKNKSKTRPYGYGKVYQRKKGKSWTMDFYDSSGKRIQKSIPDATCREKAELALELERIKTFDKAHSIDVEKSLQKKIGFRTFGKDYHDVYMTTNRRNFRPDVYRLQILCDYFKDRDLRTFTPLDFERLKAWLLRRGCSKSTVNRYLQLLKNFLNVAINEGYLEENPARKVKLYSEKDNLKERILTEKEEEKLMENCSDTLKPIIAVALNTGMRKSEVLNLTWNQIDLQARRIKVEKTKSGKPRFIPMNNDLFKLILKLKSKNGQSDFVFFNPETKQPFLDMKTGFKTACRNSGIKGLRFHDLRHTFATRLRKGGVPIEDVSDFLGHSSIIITQRYSHRNEEKQRKAVEVLCKKSDEKV